MENNKFIFATDDKYLYDVYYETKISFSPELSKFPTLSSLNTEDDFNSEAHLWKKQIKKQIKNKIMPLPLSLSVYAPEIANIPNTSFSKNLKDSTIVVEPNILNIVSDSKYFDYRRNPPLPITFPEIFDKFITEDSTDDGKSTLSNQVVHIGNQKTISINTYTQDDPKWGSFLIPQEPSPELFESYESYKRALNNWASLQNKKLSLLHPSEFISSIGIVHNENEHLKNSNKLCVQDENEKSDEFPKLIINSTIENKTFNEKEFLNVKSKNIPPPPLLMQLFSLTYKDTKNINSLSIIKYTESNTPNVSELSKSLPFKPPYTKKALIRKVQEIENSNSESTRTIRMIKSYKIITDPCINKVFISDIKSVKMTLSTDFSPNQTEEYLKQLNSQQYDSLTKELPFFLHQLHVIKSNRVRCRFFVIISNILETNPKLISTFFADVQTLSNVASILADFSFYDSRIYTYDEKYANDLDLDSISALQASPMSKRKSLINSNASPTSDPLSKRKSTFSIRKPTSIKQAPQIHPSDIKKTVNDLLFFLFANQLLKVLMNFVEKYQPKNRNLLLQINAQTMTFSRFIDISLTDKIGDIEFCFQNPCPTVCLIFHFLCDHNPLSLSKLFQTTPFYIFLGKVHMSPSCGSFFGEMCAHILRIPKLRRIFFLQFFHTRCLMSSKSIMLSIVPTLNFLSSLIKTETDSDVEHDISVDELFTSFTNVTQLVFFSPSSSLNLIGSIITFFLKIKHHRISNLQAGTVSSSINSPSSNTTAAAPTTPTTSAGNNNHSSNHSSNSGNALCLSLPVSSAYPSVAAAAAFCGVVNNNAASSNSNFDASINRTFEHIRESLITLFKDPNLAPSHIATLYELVGLMIIPYRNDTKSFIERYLSTIVLANMKSQDETIAVASWDAFREIFFDSNFYFLRDMQQIKASLSLIVASKRNLMPPVLIEILFLALGVSNKTFSFSSSVSERDISKKKKMRRSINLFDQTEGFVIPGINPREIYKEVLKCFEEGKLKDFTNEVLTLKIMMPSFKWKKRTISCV